MLAKFWQFTVHCIKYDAGLRTKLLKNSGAISTVGLLLLLSLKEFDPVKYCILKFGRNGGRNFGGRNGGGKVESLLVKLLLR